MIDLKESYETKIQTEVLEFDREYGGTVYGGWAADTWTRKEVDGELEAWIPHDDYGELPKTSKANPELRDELESKYQNSSYS